MNIRERRFALPIRASLFISLAICMVSLWSIFGSAAETEPADSSPASAVQAGRSEDGDDPGTAGALRKAEALKYTGIVAEGEDFYYVKEGIIQKDQLIRTGGKTCYFDGEGKAVKGTSKKIGKAWLVFDQSGALSTGRSDHILRTGDGGNQTGYLVHKDGKAFKKGWNSWKKKKVWIQRDGRMACGLNKIGKHRYFFTNKGWLGTSGKDRIVTVGGKDYLVLKSGELGSGWCSLDDKYCFCKKTGELLKDTVKDKIRINKNGLAKTRPMTPLEKKADSVVRSITNANMSQSSKIAACWNYVTSHARFSYRAEYDPGAYTQSEFRRLALLMLNIHGGNCYGFAATFAALTKAAGCDSYVIYGLCPGTRDQRPDGLTRHSWVYISGHGYYDPEGAFAGFANIYSSGSCPWIEHGRVAI